MSWHDTLTAWQARLPRWARWLAWACAAAVIAGAAMWALLRIATPPPKRSSLLPTTEVFLHVDRAEQAAAVAAAADAQAEAKIAAYATQAQAIEEDHATLEGADSIAAVDAVLYGHRSRAPGPPDA